MIRLCASGYANWPLSAAGSVIGVWGNLHKIAGVVRAGRFHSKEELDALSADIAAQLRR